MRFDTFYRKDRPLVFGHRGASAYAPMNTLPAFELAMAQGADGVELDVWLSKDGQLVVIHDATVDHTTNGSGYVWDMTLAQLQALDASYRFPGYGGTWIPTLDEVFSALGRLLLINVEIKWADEALPGVEQAVAECIQKHGLEERVLVSSFEPKVLTVFKKLMPTVPVAFLFEADPPALTQGVEALHPYEGTLEASAVKAWTSRGYRVNTWTVNDTVRARELAAWGVDAIITDMPDKMIEALGHGAARGE